MSPLVEGAPPPAAQHPQPLYELAPGLSLARGGPGRTLNVYLLGTVVLDSGVRWSRRRLQRQLAGRRLTAHALTHAHFDHAGCSAWLCQTVGVPLWCGAGDAAAISSGRVDTHGSPAFNRLQRTLLPVTAHPVTRVLREGDGVEGFEVLEVPGHAPGALAFWRQRDRVLVCGDVLGNVGCAAGGCAWCCHRRRYRRTPGKTDALLADWLGCGLGLPALGTAWRSPTRAGSRPPSTRSYRGPHSDTWPSAQPPWPGWGRGASPTGRRSAGQVAPTAHAHLILQPEIVTSLVTQWRAGERARAATVDDPVLFGWSVRLRRRAPAGHPLPQPGPGPHPPAPPRPGGRPDGVLAAWQCVAWHLD
jgi:hydroxyacylglutathione hydrolase